MPEAIAAPLPVGHVVALHNSIHNRFVKLTDGGAETSPTHAATDLPKDWTWERFLVVDAGNGEIALHNKVHNRFLRMNGEKMDASAKADADKLTAGMTWEMFKVVDAGGGQIALHNKIHNR